MKKLFLWMWTAFLILMEVSSTTGQAYVIQPTTKEFLNFEILNMTMNAESMTITGWAFINENQHFRSAADHTIQLEFVSQEGSYLVDTTLTNLSMTSSYEQLGLPYCAEGVYNSSTCNYTYDYVGFTVTIAMSRFTPGTLYTTNIVVLALNSKTYLKTPLYYPIISPVSFRVGDYDYSISSHLSDTQIKVIETPVYARKAPGKTSTIWATGTNCSMTYTNKLYFKFGSVYTQVLSKTIQDNQTYYEVAAKLDLCVDMRRRIVEGNVLTPVWIPGMFVEYSGSPLQISSVLINTNPWIEASDFEIFLPKTVNFLDYAKSYDAEEGDLSSKIQIESTTYQDRPGIYQITYYVQDKYGYEARRTVNITVKSALNTPPIIEATNRTVLRNSIFDAFVGVSAYDTEDGDLTANLIALNSIDTSILGTQELCYGVYDSATAYSTKCIIITVYDDQIQYNRFRFVSRTHLFHGETVPNLWIGLVDQLQSFLDNLIALNSSGF